MGKLSKISQLLAHPSELRAVIQFMGFRQDAYKKDRTKQADSLNRCYELLFLTSRSFAAVIDELHPELRDVVMIFYLLLRALDTVEDDMSLDVDAKVPWLISFHELLKLKEYSYHEVSEQESDRVVLVEFTEILTEFHKLKPHYQDVLVDISKRMGAGMAQSVLDELKSFERVQTLEDFDLYCHYVAGIVGEGLTKLFILAKFSDESVADNNYSKANSMGLFLQKANIIRDFNEDLNEGRSFWPKQIWSNHIDKLSDFVKPVNKTQGVQCISELVLNGLNHVEDVLEYLSMIKEPTSFNFCAIPQVMAIATLEMVYNNPDVLYKNVKIRRGTTCKLILKSRTFPGVIEIFREYLRKINHKSKVEDPSYFKIGTRIAKLEQLCDMLYPEELAIPPGVKVTNKYRELALSRAPIDDEVTKMIALEALKCNLAILAALAALGGLIYTVLSFL